ncbi:hypothetical protein L484_017121 [Morus notabilis]|uniref:Uncharacterized protein n=1 Tax=Morus notabilis TaxID=981085 RepID=W9S1N5_9ROSA|nr:hypothetical protein L484_017121 [Morus notabilis]
MAAGSCEHEDYSPHVVAFRLSGQNFVPFKIRSRVGHQEGIGNNHGHRFRHEYPDALHRENGSNEHSDLLVGVFRHDHGRERVIPANAEPKPEPKEAEGCYDALRRVAEGKARGYGAAHHCDESEAENLFPAEFVSEPAKEELPCKGSA